MKDIADIYSFQDKEESKYLLVIQYTIYIGLNDKMRKEQIIDTSKAIQIVNSILLNYTSNFTVTQSEGYYRYKDSIQIKENVLCYTIISFNSNDLYTFIKEVKVLLNQESILVTSTCVFNHFY
ncbi:hypothetical protein WA158_002780 [Blastocystis sp. Blastoise]